jgi:hypothetical protein
MHIQVHTSFADLPRDLVEQCGYPAQQDFFSTLDWYRCLYDNALRSSMTPRIYVLRDADGQAMAALFCGVEQDGRSLVGMSNFYTLDFAPVVFCDAPLQTIASALAAFIAAERPRWESVDLRLMQSDMLAQSGLQAALRSHGFHVDGFFQYENWYLTVDGQGFDDYYAGRSSRLRNTIKRKEKKLAKAHDYRIRVYTEDDAALTRAIDEYTRIYNSSWKQPEPFPDFTPQLIRNCARLGLLRLGMLYIDEQAAAAQLWITTPAKAVIYKLAYSEAHSSLSPGSILSREMFRQALDDDRVAEIDYGIGSENYKKDWMASVREMRGVHALNTRTLKGAALAAVEAAKSVGRRLRPPAD